jgi:hypothetical protein
MNDETENPKTDDPRTGAPKRKGIFIETQKAQQVVDYLKRQHYDEVALLIANLIRAPEVTL